MQEHLRAWLQKPAADVRVEVTGQKHDLEKHHAGRPNAGRATKPWQEVLANQRLDLKQQKCACENRKRVSGHCRIMGYMAEFMKSKANATRRV